MPQREDIVTVSGPIIQIYEPSWVASARYTADIIYSVQLANGLTVTSPGRFPQEAGESGKTPDAGDS